MSWLFSVVGNWFSSPYLYPSNWKGVPLPWYCCERCHKATSYYFQLSSPFPVYCGQPRTTCYHQLSQIFGYSSAYTDPPHLPLAPSSSLARGSSPQQPGTAGAGTCHAASPEAPQEPGAHRDPHSSVQRRTPFLPQQGLGVLRWPSCPDETDVCESFLCQGRGGRRLSTAWGLCVQTLFST